MNTLEAKKENPKFTKVSEIIGSKMSLDFADWLMENCELSEDKSLWSYNSEDYTNEKLFEIFYKQEFNSLPNEFEKDLFDLINGYCKKGLKKPDLVKKMEWVLGSCKMS